MVKLALKKQVKPLDAINEWSRCLKSKHWMLVMRRMTATVYVRLKPHLPLKRAKLSLKESQEAKGRPQIREVELSESVQPGKL